MKRKPSNGLTALILAALCAFAPVPASAQSAGGGAGRDTVYAVSGVSVEQTAANAAAAQEAAFASARRIGFDRLVRRLTPPQELASRAAPAPDAAALERLVLSVDVADERRSSTRYIGRLTVRFDPSSVRTLLRGQGFTVIDTRTSPVLVVPLSSVVWTGEDQSPLWRQAWEQGGFQGELAPLAVAPVALAGAPDWRAAAPYANAEGATTALYATLSIQGSTASAALVEISANGVRRDRGAVSAQIAGLELPQLRTALASLAEQASARIQSEWKASIAAGAGQRGRLSASALYQNQRQWESIKQALEGAAQTLISEIRIEAVGREGALVSFSFVGDRTQLAAELNRRGVRLDDTAMGPVLRVTGN